MIALLSHLSFFYIIKVIRITLHILNIIIYKNFCHFIMDNYRKIIKIDGLTAPAVIPPTWYKYEKEDVDSNTRRTAIHDLFKQWIEHSGRPIHPG